jgi:hypothetical protein
MEQIVPTPNESLFDLQLDPAGIEYLREGAKWAKFIAIMGFIFCGLMVLVALFAGTMITAYMGSAGASPLSGGFVTVIYLAFAALWFVPCLYLFRFASNMQTAVRSNEQQTFVNALKNLKSHFKFIGILLIVTLAIYVVAIIGVVIFAASAGFGSLN